MEQLIKDMIRGKKRFKIEINGVLHEVSKMRYYANGVEQEYFGDKWHFKFMEKIEELKKMKNKKRRCD